MKTFLAPIPLLLMLACAPITTHHGNSIKEAKFAAIKIGASSKENVSALLGSPNYISLDGFRLWLYIAQENIAWLPTFETEKARRVIAIYFDKKGIVVDKKALTLENGKNISYIAQTIPPPIPELNWVQRLFSNIGRVSPAGVPQSQGP